MMGLLGALIALALTLAAAPSVQDHPCYRERFEGANFTVCRYDAARDELRIAWTGEDGRPLRSLARLSASPMARRAPVRFAMNAGMFDEDGAPIGLFVEDGRVRRPLNTRDGPGNFHLSPNGVFFVDADGEAHVQTTAAFRAGKAAARFATQSGPMLVIDGRLHPAIQADGPSRYVRNAVGVADARAAFFVISDRPVSFGKLARLFRDRLHCPNALYLDGSVSSLWAPSLKRLDDSFPLGPLVVVTRSPHAR